MAPFAAIRPPPRASRHDADGDALAGRRLRRLVMPSRRGGRICLGTIGAQAAARQREGRDRDPVDLAVDAIPRVGERLARCAATGPATAMSPGFAALSEVEGLFFPQDEDRGFDKLGPNGGGKR
jgi:hypothetical protein